MMLETFIKKEIPCINNDEVSKVKQFLVSIEVVPLTNTVEPYYLILFSKELLPEVAPASFGKNADLKINAEAKKQIERLEKELAMAREDMRSISEDQEIANEELQSANEELQSSNEEMQSLNEELETSKEEIQSTNEELTIVNSELLEKQYQLNAASHYSDNLIATIRDPLIVLDKNLRIKTASTSFYKKFNSTKEQTEGKLFYEIQNHQWNNELVRSLLEKILPEKEKLSDFEITLKFPLLGERHMLLNGRQIIDETTAQKLILLAIEDVTERKEKAIKLEEAYTNIEEKNNLLAASEKRFSNILSQSIMAIAIFKGPEMVISFANEPMIEILGKGNSVINKPLLEGVPELKDQIFPKLISEVYNTGVAFEGYEEKAVIEKNGIAKDYYFNFIYQPYRDVDDSITGITVLATDVTVKVLAQNQIDEIANQFRFLAEAVPQKIFTAKPDGDIDYTNPQWNEFTGLSFEQIKDWEWIKLVHPDDIEKSISVWQHSIDTGESLRLEHRFLSHSGEYRWLLSVAKPMRNSDGEIIKWFGTNTDIQDQKMQDQKKDDFITIASHELKTPLTTAKGYIELLLHSINKEDKSLYLFAGKVDQAVNRLRTMVTELLDVSKIEHGKFDYNVSSFNFDELLEETIENVQLNTSTHRLIKTGSITQEIAGDKDRLQQVIINLLTNAIKYSPEGKEVLINVSVVDKNLKVSIQDFGIGIENQHLAKLFDRYYRVQEQAAYFQGMGIGLFISYEIIKQHKGDMWVESEPGKGTKFYFSIPV